MCDSEAHATAPHSTVPRRSALARTLRLALRVVVLLTLCVLGLEVCLRMLLLNRLPIMPFYLEQGEPKLPAMTEFSVITGHSAPSHYVTDRGGARVASTAAQDPARIRDGDLLVIGDSQAMGYLMAFEDTFAGCLAQRLLGNPNRVRVLAAPGADPASSLRSLRRYKASYDLHEPELAVIVLNLGNDLDELFLAGARVKYDTPAGTRWLTMHCRIFAEWTSIHTRYLSPAGWGGVNPVLYNMDAVERVFLAREAVTLVEDQIAELKCARRVIVVVIPCSYQVDPELFEVFRASYPDPRIFEKWKVQVDSLAQMMTAVEGFIVRELSDRGHQVLRVSDLARNDGPGRKWYVEDTDHLTAYGHARITERITALVGTGKGSSSP